MKLAVMQPYFLPYIGYFQLIAAVDIFVVYDNIKFTKKGWFNRNRILVGGKSRTFTVPVKRDPDYLNVVQRELADNFNDQALKILRRIRSAYRKAPYYSSVMPLVEVCFQRGNGNLFSFIYTSLILLTRFLEIGTDVVTSSSIDIDHALKAQDKVLAICEKLGADTYINAIGGQKLYSEDAFTERGIDLWFIKTGNIEYKQFGGEFVPWLSIIDIMMFNPKRKMQEYLHNYSLVRGE